MAKDTQPIARDPMGPQAAAGANRNEEGFTLIEAIMSIFILTLLALSLGQLVGVGMLANKTSADMTQATALSGAKLEQLRNGDYNNLVAGGSLDADVIGYHETLDTNADGNDDYQRRWLIGDQPGGKTVEVRTIALKGGIGPAKAATMATVIGNR